MGITWLQLRQNTARHISGVDTPAKRCTDYDTECVDVPNHLACWQGGCRTINGVEYVTDQADGYCPFLIGMESR